MNHKVTIFIIGLVITVEVFAISIDEKAKPKITGTSLLDQTQDSQPKTIFDQLSTTETAKVLGWIKGCDSGNICGGRYFESSNLVNTPNPKPFQDTPMDITAVKPAFFTKHGASVIQGDVILSQPGREVVADKVTFFRDNKSGKLSVGMLYGNVRFREYGKLIVADSGNLDFINKIYSLNHGIYRLLAKTPTGLANVWGRAKYAVRDATGILQLKQASYSACPPDATVWHLWGNNLILNRDTGRGEVKNALLFLRKVPIFYTPYFNFPIDDRRKSGFLIPTPTVSKGSGYGVNLPYYFNLAPDYDLLFTPEIFTERGVLFDGLFRYLTPTSTGYVDISYIPYDRAFVKFRDSTLLGNNAEQDMFRALKKSSSGRGLLSLQNGSNFDEFWQSALNINYATDDYFLQDFNVMRAGGDKDQLLNRADIRYSSDRWNFLGRLQIFQTLHQITQQKTKDQYMRLPQLNLAGNFPDVFGGLDYRLDSEIVNFMYGDSLEYAPTLVTNGVRFNMMPSVSAPFSWLDVNIVPKIQFQITGYDTYNQQKTGNANSIIKPYPLISIDSNTVLKRDIHFFHKEYTQTFEPRVFYLLVPMRNQNGVPLFDTYLPAFDFNQLFRTNRFSGIDRVGDAHQIAVAVSTKFLDDYGQERLNAGIGQIIVIHKHQVVLKDASGLDPLVNERLSPLVGQLRYVINSQVNTTFNMAWDPSYQHLNTAEAKLQYINNPDRIINFWYNYVRQGDKLQEIPIDLSRIGVSVGWQMRQRWNIIGSMNYNTSYKCAQNYLYGIEYNSCCWAARVIHSRNFIGMGANNSNNYDSRTYVQVLLKGLGDSGDNGLSSIVTNNISGYQDKFTKRV